MSAATCPAQLDSRKVVFWLEFRVLAHGSTPAEKSQSQSLDTGTLSGHNSPDTEIRRAIGG